MLQFEFRVLQKQISHVWQFVSLGQPIGSLCLMHACLSACLSVYQYTCMSLCLPVTWAWTLTDSDYIARSLHYIWNCPIIAITKQTQCKRLTMTWKWVYTQKTTAGGIKAGWRGLNRGGGEGGMYTSAVQVNSAEVSNVEQSFGYWCSDALPSAVCILV